MRRLYTLVLDNGEIHQLHSMKAVNKIKEEKRKENVHVVKLYAE